MERIILLLVVTLTIVSASAQEEYEEILTLQPKVGLNVSNISYGNNDPRIAANFGLELEYRKFKMVSFSCALLYSMQGDRCTGYHESYGKIKATEKIDYITFPVLMNIYVMKGLAVKIGFQPAINMLARLNVEAGGRTEESSFSDIYGATVNTFDMAIPFGISYDFGGVVIEGRYNLGLTDMINNADVKNRVFQLTLGYKFKL